MPNKMRTDKQLKAYENMRKVDPSIIVQLRIHNQCLTLDSIAQSVGCTKERVRQILRNNCLPTRGFVQHYKCLNCGKDIGPTPKRFCNRKCSKEYTHIPVECPECHKIFSDYKDSILRRVANGGPIFCSHYMPISRYIEHTLGRKVVEIFISMWIPIRVYIVSLNLVSLNLCRE
jgi:DNA-directed RNA polymerase subunit RPC12/RpoP